MHDEGFVGVLDSAESSALDALRAALARAPAAPAGFRAPVMLSTWHVDAICTRMRLRDLYTVVDVFANRLGLGVGGAFAVADLERIAELAAELDRAAPGLSVRDRFAYATAPIPRDKAVVAEVCEWARAHAAHDDVGEPRFLAPARSGARGLLESERLMQLTNAWVYLSGKFAVAYGHEERVHTLRAELAAGISTILEDDSRDLTPPGAETSVEKRRAQEDAETGRGRGGYGGYGLR